MKSSQLHKAGTLMFLLVQIFFISKAAYWYASVKFHVGPYTGFLYELVEFVGFLEFSVYQYPVTENFCVNNTQKLKLLKWITWWHELLTGSSLLVTYDLW